MQTSLPASALKHLEPYPGGSWTVSGETADTVTVSYSCVDNPGVVSYTLHQCRTEQDVMARCQSHMYNFEPGDEKLARIDSFFIPAVQTGPAPPSLDAAGPLPTIVLDPHADPGHSA
ncbi:hypothetical protein ACQRIU_006152 [Beauveria bassiana]